LHLIEIIKIYVNLIVPYQDLAIGSTYRIKFCNLYFFHLYQSSAPVHLDTWGLDPLDHHLSTNLNLIRRYPSPLSQYGLGSALERQKKVFLK